MPYTLPNDWPGWKFCLCGQLWKHSDSLIIHRAAERLSRAGSWHLDEEEDHSKHILWVPLYCPHVINSPVITFHVQEGSGWIWYHQGFSNNKFISAREHHGGTGKCQAGLKHIFNNKQHSCEKSTMPQGVAPAICHSRCRTPCAVSMQNMCYLPAGGTQILHLKWNCLRGKCRKVFSKPITFYQLYRTGAIHVEAESSERGTVSLPPNFKGRYRGNREIKRGSEIWVRRCWSPWRRAVERCPESLTFWNDTAHCKVIPQLCRERWGGGGGGGGVRAHKAPLLNSFSRFFPFSKRWGFRRIIEGSEARFTLQLSTPQLTLVFQCLRGKFSMTTKRDACVKLHAEQTGL